jgi:hypothetical protein
VKRNLTKSGSWKVTCIEGDKQADVANRIFAVEKKSWKEKWRLQRGEIDWGLHIILRAVQKLSQMPQNLRWRTWFLELEGKTIAYVLGIIYKNVAILAKTSYDNQYRKLTPGIITQILAVQQLFNENQSKYIDFLSDLPFMRLWTNTCLPRIGVEISKGIVPTILLILRQKLISTVRSSPFLMKQAEIHISQRKFAKIFDAFLDRFL